MHRSSCRTLRRSIAHDHRRQSSPALGAEAGARQRACIFPSMRTKQDRRSRLGPRRSSRQPVLQSPSRRRGRRRSVPDSSKASQRIAAAANREVPRHTRQPQSPSPRTPVRRAANRRSSPPWYAARDRWQTHRSFRRARPPEGLARPRRCAAADARTRLGQAL